MFTYALEMLIVRHLGTPNSPFPLTSMDVTGCVIQYYCIQINGPNASTPVNLLSDCLTVFSLVLPSY